MLDISPVRLIEQLARLQISYNLCNLPKQITAEDGTLVNYTYFADGTKFKAIDATGKGFVYTGSLRWSVQNGTLTPESVAITGGRALYNDVDEPWSANYYITDHLGSVRAVTDAEGEVLGTFDYMPYGSEISSRSNTTTDYRFTGKERQSMVNNSIYDSFARFQNTYGRFMSIDPKAESFYHISPYAYCAGDPVNLVDPDGEKIYFASGVSDKFKEAFATVIKIMNKKGTSWIFRKLEESDKVYYIQEINYKETGDTPKFDPNTNTIYWDPNIQVLTENYVVLSPPTILAHEAAHALQKDKYSDQEFVSKYKKDPNYGNILEKEVITGIEQEVAIKHGDTDYGTLTRISNEGKILL